MKKAVKAAPPEICFMLAQVMEDRGYSKNRLCHEADLRFETVRGYYQGTISRIDLHVLVALCRVLRCNISDIIAYRSLDK